MNNKSIDINQRIPLETLYTALEAYLNDNYSNEYIMEQLRLEYSGENRLKKALRIVNRIIPKNPLMPLINVNKAAIKLVIKKKQDRDIILIALLNSAFPFSYDVLKIFGKYFAVQEIINANTVKKSISNIYGGNRATENGIYSVVPMFLEAGFFNRPKQGIYQWDKKLIASSNITEKIYLESFKLNNSINEIQEYQLMDPYFQFIRTIQK
ncbi:hypothetical protein AAT17_12580 [Nonlabens sp. MIC269]|uniref:hypothetical protein n=1 Tax=Nonlabens sp. MIC269 TaxID=1476901 RepID=UPI000721D0F4|nr:hypothetical protein [Nonlabens sp. MIC269]ALM22006.1 hypothetical protein AAT17_12580 [Nonlabens sp. MIC269]